MYVARGFNPWKETFIIINRPEGERNARNETVLAFGRKTRKEKVMGFSFPQTRGLAAPGNNHVPCRAITTSGFHPEAIVYDANWCCYCDGKEVTPPDLV